MFDTRDEGDANYNWSSLGVASAFAAPSPSTLLQLQPRRPRLEQHVLYITADPGHKPGNAELKVQFYNQAVKPVMQGSDRGSVNRLLHQIIMKIGRHVDSSLKWQKASL